MLRAADYFSLTLNSYEYRTFWAARLVPHICFFIEYVIDRPLADEFGNDFENLSFSVLIRMETDLAGFTLSQTLI